jgi:hypothetical protein
MIFGLSILVTAILLSAVAAYYSVAGLTAIFSAATIPVIIMGGSLELGKIVATVWLHNNWRRAPMLFKAYLVPAVAFLMLLTSMGIFGYLSKAHSDQSLVSGDAVARVAIYDEKIKISKDNIDANRRALKQMDEAVDQVMGRSEDEKGADKAVAIRRGQTKERTRLLSEIAAEQKTIAQLNEERAPLAAEFRKVESEVGPIKYIAALVYGDNPDQNVLEKAVRLVIIMIVLVFDPLALTLILAANKQFEWARQGTGGFIHDEPEPEPKYEPDDGPLTKDQITQLKASVAEPPDDPIPCNKCGTPLVDAPGIGLFCPNKECDIIDNTKGEEPVKFEPIEIEYKFVDEYHEPEPDLHVYDDERMVSQFDKQQLSEEESDLEKEAKRLWKSQNPDESLKQHRRLHQTGAIEKLPWEGYINLQADNEGTISAVGRLRGFGIRFPDDPAKGDSFIRVDQMPSALYKYNGLKWIEVDKGLSDQYAYDTAYIDHLIEKLTTGEYDPELLNDAEREQVAQRLQTNSKGA